MESFALPARLELGARPAERFLAPGSTHRYELQLQAGEFVRLVVDVPTKTARATVVARVLDPDGMTLGESAGFRWPKFAVWAVAPVTGLYQIHVQLERDQPVRYAMRVAETRPATERDLISVAAERTLADARHLETADTAAARRQAHDMRQAAITMFRQNGDLVGEAYGWLTLAPMEYQGDLAAKVEALKNARRAFQDAGDPAMQAFTAESIGGFLLNSLYEAPSALEYFQQARSLYEQLGDRDDQTNMILSIAKAHADVGDFAHAIAEYERARDEFHAAGSIREDPALVDIAVLYERMNDYERALTYLDQAAEVDRRKGDRGREVGNLVNAASVRVGLGDVDGARSSVERARQVCRTIADDRACEIRLAGPLAEVHLRRGEPDQALSTLEDALRYHRSVSRDRLQQVDILRHMAEAYFSLGDRQNARQRLVEALALWPALNAARLDVLLKLAWVSFDLGDTRRADEYSRQLLNDARKVSDPQWTGRALAGIARLEQRAGRLDVARRDMDAALENIEAYRALVPGPEARTMLAPRMEGVYEADVDLLMAMHRAHPDQHRDADALLAADRMRARVLLEILSGTKVDLLDDVDPALADRTQDLRRRLNAAGTLQLHLLGQQHSEPQAARLSEQIRDLRAAYGLAEAQLRAASPRYAAITQPPPLTLRDIQQNVLDDETVLVEYALGAERSYVWAVTRHAVVSAELPNRAAIEALARRHRDLLSESGQLPAAQTSAARAARLAQVEADERTSSAELSRVLLGPIAGDLNRKRLLIVADGALQYVPFASLPEPAVLGESSSRETLPGETLVARHEIVNLPSVAAVGALQRERTMRPRPPDTVAILADPVFDAADSRVHAATGAAPSSSAPALARLPFSLQEAEAIASASQPSNVFEAVGLAATRESAMGADIARARIVHFATHARLNDDAPELSGIVLSLVDASGHQLDGLLRLDDIYRLKLSADLVVLSGCETALGKDVRGEGLIGLTRGFMYAGAPRVVSSLWTVDDAATAALMARFYRGMLSEGLSPAAALRAAQIDISRETRWRSPYYWAAFQLHGDWR